MTEQMVPPDTCPEQLAPQLAPVDHDGGFLNAARSLSEIKKPLHTDLARNEAYAKYMRMHKVLVGNHGASFLEDIYDELKNEDSPHYLSAAGWAVAEAALVRTDTTVHRRLGLLDKAITVWDRALGIQKDIEHQPDVDGDRGYMHRIALDIAVKPLLSGVIAGNVTQTACKRCL